MTISDWLVIIAILLGPVLAVQIDKFIERKKERRNEKKYIFANLMATRAAPVSPQHVEALNKIDIAFYKDKKILDARKDLMLNFEKYPEDTGDPGYMTKLNICSEKSKELLVNLLCEMGTSLGYDFDRVHLERGAYMPRGQAEIEWEQALIRKNFVRLFLGQTAIPIKIVNGEMSEQS